MYEIYILSYNNYYYDLHHLYLTKEKNPEKFN